MWNRTPFSTRLAAEYLAMLAVPTVGMPEWPRLSPHAPHAREARAERGARLGAWENEGGAIAPVPMPIDYSPVYPPRDPVRH